jgi:hypothetical protein
VLDDGESESRAAGFPGMTFIHAVEALKHAAVVLRRDADACVGDGQRYPPCGVRLDFTVQLPFST